MTTSTENQQEPLSNVNWREAPFVSAIVDYSEIEETDIDTTKISWLGTKVQLSDTPQEQLETRLATKEQVEKGIVDEFGIPTGYSYDEMGIPKHVQEQIKLKRQEMARNNPTVKQEVPVEKPTFNNKYERKAWREKERLRQKEEEKRLRLSTANQKIKDHQTNKGIYQKFGI